MVYEIDGLVMEKAKLQEGVFYISVEAPSIASEVYPGQFVLVRVSKTADPPLRRPFSVAWVEDGRIGILFSVVGRGTRLLSEVDVGERLSLRGPLGRGFPHSSFKLLLVAGGMGIAPILFAHQIYDGRVVFGVRDESYKGLCDWVKERVKDDLYLFSEDGSIGEKGTAVDGALSLLEEDTEVWACGPEAMLESLTFRLKGGAKRILGSLERRMACGIGGCYGCSIRTKGGMKRTCYDGPVFDLREVF
ncbi:MAG: dihydroorotate dehydrogenase electron transfer subunit [Synergistetes bacterium]|nr:dihydroorotate dehydrogenase electron transfer subunit [Synergistota bacterium]